MAEPIAMETALQRAAHAVDFLLAMYRERAGAGIKLPTGDLYLGNLGCAVLHAKLSRLPREDFFRMAEELYRRMDAIQFRPD